MWQPWHVCVCVSSKANWKKRAEEGMCIWEDILKIYYWPFCCKCLSNFATQVGTGVENIDVWGGLSIIGLKMIRENFPERQYIYIFFLFNILFIRFYFIFILFYCIFYFILFILSSDWKQPERSLQKDEILLNCWHSQNGHVRKNLNRCSFLCVHDYLHGQKLMGRIQN